MLVHRSTDVTERSPRTTCTTAVAAAAANNAVLLQLNFGPYPPQEVRCVAGVTVQGVRLSAYCCISLQPQWNISARRRPWSVAKVMSSLLSIQSNLKPDVNKKTKQKKKKTLLPK